jgi:hypothetical protein
MYRHKVIKNVKLIKARIKLRLFIDLALIKNNIHFGQIFLFLFSPKHCTTYSFCEIGFFNEADTLESSSILIYSHFRQSLFTRKDRHNAELIKVN